MRLSIPVLLTTTAVAAAIGAGAPARAAALHAARTVKGPSVSMKWGPVQATIIVQGKRLVDIRIAAPLERPRSAFINQIAIPRLRSEVLKAQSARVSLVSGATMTSQAFVQSLQAALAAAHI